MDPAWGHCFAGIQGVYDPPQALHPAETVVAPTMPAATGQYPTTTTSATPAATAQPMLPTSTTQLAGTSVAPTIGDTDSTSFPAEPTNHSEAFDDHTQSTSSRQSVKTATDASDFTAPSTAAQPASSSLTSEGVDPTASPLMTFAQSTPTAPDGTDMPASTSENTPTHVGGIAASILGAGSNPATSSGSRDPQAVYSTTSTALQNALSVLAAAQTSTTIDISTQAPSDPSRGSLMQTTAQPANADPIVSRSGSVVSTADPAGELSDSATETRTLVTGSNDEPSDPASLVATVGSQAFAISQVASDPSAVAVAYSDTTTTITAGQQSASVGGQRFSVQPGGGAVVGTGSEAQTFSASSDNGGPGPANSQAFESNTQGANPMVTSVDTLTLVTNAVTITQEASSSDPTVIAYGSSTLTVGGSAAFMFGHVFSAAPEGILVNGFTMASSAAASSTSDPTATAVAVFTLGSDTLIGTQYQADGMTVLGFGANTITAGGPATMVPGEVLNVASDGVVIDTSTVLYTTPSTETDASVVEVTIGSSVLTASARTDGAVVVDGSMTLSEGGQATVIESQSWSAGSEGLVVGGTTVGWTPQSPASSQPVESRPNTMTGPGQRSTPVSGTGSSAAFASGATAVSTDKRLVISLAALTGLAALHLLR